MMNLVIFEERAEIYKAALTSKFSDLAIHAATDEAELAKVAEQMDILLTFRISDELLARASRLQWIQSLATGTDRLVSLPSLRKEVIVTSTRGIHGPQMSEMAFLLMLAFSRGFPQMVRNQDIGLWERWPARLLFGKKVAIFGLGAIGAEIARKCKAFGMIVYGIDIVQRQVEAIDRLVGPEGLGDVAPEVDFLIVVAPYTANTYHVINEAVLSRMKETAYLINIARGELVDDGALIVALKGGLIAGAALDVFTEEPLPAGHPYWGMKNVIVTPHVGGSSDIYVEQALTVFEENLRRFMKGERQNLINMVAR